MLNEEYKPVYNKNVGRLEFKLLVEKTLPNELSSYHGHIGVNVEYVDFDDEEEYENGLRILRDMYEKLKNDLRFKNRIVYHSDVDEIEILG